MTQESVRELRDPAYAQSNVQLPEDGPTGGFGECYGSDALRDQTVRVLAWRMVVPLDEFIKHYLAKKRRCA